MSARISVPEITIGSHISVIKRENKIKRSEYLEKGHIPVIDQGQGFIAGYIDDESRAYDGPLPVIVFGDHTCTKKFVDFRFAVGADGTQLLRPKCPEQIDIRYFYYALLCVPVEQFGYQRHFKYLKDAKIPLPDLNCQRKIAAILSAYDDLIENNLRRIKILEEMAQSIYREWFVKFRFPGHQKVKMVDSLLGKIPEGWEVEQIGDVIETLGGGTPSTKELSYWEGGNIDWYTPSDLTASGSMFINGSSKKIANLGLEKSSAKLFPAYSLMMTSRATIGVIAINTQEACTNQGFITCVPNKRLSVFHLYFWVKENREKIISVASGATYKEISRGEFREFLIVVPPPPIENTFTKNLEPMCGLIENLIKINLNLRKTRDLLLPKLISGELDVSELDIKID